MQKNAQNSGVGQYFTPRPVISAMVDCIQPKPKETIADPACGTGGFFLGAVNYLNQKRLSASEANFLTMLNANGRAAVVLPDNVLFEGGAGETIDAQGVKANVLFFEKKKTGMTPLTEEVCYYDYRTNIRHTPKKNPLRVEHLKEFIACYQADSRKSYRYHWVRFPH